MFGVVELMFSNVEYTFNDVEFKFNDAEHRFLLMEITKERVHICRSIS